MLGILTNEEIGEVLQNNIVCRIGCNDGTKTYVVPVSYVYMGDHILCHSYDGMKIEMMRAQPAVCLEVDEIKSYDNWRCVIVWGEYEELTEAKDINEARGYFSEEMLDMKVSETALPPESTPERWHNTSPGQKVSIYYRIRFTEASGRFERSM
jgi:nitroimidazol reductase NimA-like FMN-containing flavoprotein (pyridoxamine 5'-phosphate oxidase superfamily)